MCRRASGAAFATWVSFPKANFSLTSGEPSRFKSSERVERSFCNRCGTAITFAETARPDEIDLTVGSFDEPECLSPEDHIWTDARLRWLRVDDGLPEYSQDLPSRKHPGFRVPGQKWRRCDSLRDSFASRTAAGIVNYPECPESWTSMGHMLVEYAKTQKLKKTAREVRVSDLALPKAKRVAIRRNHAL